jgi:hypothetical protein
MPQCAKRNIHGRRLINFATSGDLLDKLPVSDEPPCPKLLYGIETQDERTSRFIRRTACSIKTSNKNVARRSLGWLNKKPNKKEKEFH